MEQSVPLAESDLLEDLSPHLSLGQRRQRLALPRALRPPRSEPLEEDPHLSPGYHREDPLLCPRQPLAVPRAVSLL